MFYYQVDVFSSKALKGNGLAVVFPDHNLPVEQMLAIAQEFRQFETIFIYHDAETFKARIFTVQEELDFAGHPILGAAAVIHHVFFKNWANKEIILSLPRKDIQTESVKAQGSYYVRMNQGPPDFLGVITPTHHEGIACRLNLTAGDLHDGLPIEVISTGLPYLLVPVKRNLAKCQIIASDFEQFIGQFGAKFVYVFDPQEMECRTWDNLGKTEDVATGSAAGPLCAYLIKHGLKKAAEIIELNQGSYVNRPSIIKTWQITTGNKPNIFIAGEVAFFAQGELII